jgi:hypothetical protein
MHTAPDGGAVFVLWGAPSAGTRLPYPVRAMWMVRARRSQPSAWSTAVRRVPCLRQAHLHLNAVSPNLTMVLLSRQGNTAVLLGQAIAFRTRTSVVRRNAQSAFSAQ